MLHATVSYNGKLDLGYGEDGQFHVYCYAMTKIQPIKMDYIELRACDWLHYLKNFGHSEHTPGNNISKFGPIINTEDSRNN
jgi:hypothetical protein